MSLYLVLFKPSLRLKLNGLGMVMRLEMDLLDELAELSSQWTSGLRQSTEFQIYQFFMQMSKIMEGNTLALGIIALVM